MLETVNARLAQYAYTRSQEIQLKRETAYHALSAFRMHIDSFMIATKLHEILFRERVSKILPKIRLV